MAGKDQTPVKPLSENLRPLFIFPTFWPPRGANA